LRSLSNFVDWVRPDAGAICCVRLKPTVFGDAAVNSFYEAVAAKGARVANGAWFGDEVRVFRLGFGLLPLAELAIALDVLTASLREIADRSRVIITPPVPQATRT
jgi:DNA-binding transcriptional MocR family regulator